MLKRIVIAAIICLDAGALPAAEPMEGRSADRWRAQPDWTPKTFASEFSCAAEGDWLAFSVKGEGKQMTWTLAPTAAELADEPRYLVLRYKAYNLTPVSGDYLLCVQDGSPSWRRYLEQKRVIPDGAEHLLVVDVLSHYPPEPINRFALRAGPVAGKEGKLLVKMGFSSQPPSGAEVVACQWPREEKVRVDFEALQWQPSPNWTTHPPEHQATEPLASSVRYSTRGQMKSMRWSSRLPKKIDLEKLPFSSMRYRARGDFGPYGYVFYLSALGKDGEKKSVYAMRPGDVNNDGLWHVYHTKLDGKGMAGASVAVGIDSLSPEAEIELDYIEFSSVPPTTPIPEMLSYEKRAGPWPAGREGFTALAMSKAERLNPFMLPRMGIGAWFDSQDISVDGVPFQVARDPSDMPCTGTVGEDDIEVALPAETREVLFLLAACFPFGEKFGSNWREDTPLRLLDEPERATIRLAYADGTSEEMLPVRASRCEYGIGHDIALYAVHPASGKTPVKMALHDRMRSACFGLVGLTVNSGAPRVKEPDWQPPWYPEVKRPPLSEAKISFATEKGLTWDRISSAMLGEATIALSRRVEILYRVCARDLVLLRSARRSDKQNPVRLPQ
jgi:hypothetical protein